ncbi:hypothetical protein VPH35_041688 [Triticum aestivum]|uniref:KIB1-4 beta-propeller domain-containing protein n=1 Tax=Aegilops tauschii TaxID=37682 RepID=M8BWG9_AEGTA
MAGSGAWRLALPPDGVEPVATAEAGTWRLRHRRNDVEDAVHHEGRFYSITYSGQVQAWEERHTDTPGMFASTVVAPRLLLPVDLDHRKYLVAAPGGRLMVVVKEGTGLQTLPSFKVQILDAGRGEWKVTDDIDQASLFVGGNGSLCVSTSTRSSGPAAFTTLGMIRMLATTTTVASGCSAERRSRALGGTVTGHRRRGSRLPFHDI